MSAVTAQALLAAFVAALERAGLEYCILAGYDSYPEEVSSDVDFMVRAGDLAKIPAALAQVGRMTGAALVQTLHHETTATYFVLAALDGHRTVFLHPDSSTDYRRYGRMWLHADSLLAERRRDRRGFFVPAPHDAFAYYLIKKLEKGELSDTQARFLSRRFHESPETCRHALRSMFLAPSAGLIANAAASEQWSEVRGNLDFLRHELRASMPTETLRTRLRQAWLELLRRAQRVLWPTGLCIAVLGPDGVGKSTVIQRILADMAPAFRRTHYQHLRPRRLRAPAMSRPVTDPHRLAPRGLIGSVAKLGVFLVDFLFGYWVTIRPMLIRSTLVVFDRYYHDILVDARRYRYGAPAALARWGSRMVPSPDLWLILDAPAETLQARKPEVSYRESARQREAYRRLAQELDHAVMIDASQSPEEVLAHVYRAILSHLARRTATRLGIEPVMLSERGRWVRRSQGRRPA